VAGVVFVLVFFVVILVHLLLFLEVFDSVLVVDEHAAIAVVLAIARDGSGFRALALHRLSDVFVAAVRYQRNGRRDVLRISIGIWHGTVATHCNVV